MARTEKIAVTVDRDVLDFVERLRRKTGESRSALVNRALRLLRAGESHRQRVEEYVEGYRAHPESDDDVVAAHALAVVSLKGVPWS